MIEPHLNKNYDFIIPIVDARRMEVYCADYNRKTGSLCSETEAKILDEASFSEFADQKVLFVGDGAKKTKELLFSEENLAFKNAEFIENVYPSAKYLIKKSVEKFNQQNFENVAYFEPFYLKDFQGVKKK